MTTKKFTDKQLMEAQREFTIARWMNQLDGQALDAIQKGKDSFSFQCNTADLPDWLITAIKESHTDWSCEFKSSCIEISFNA